MTPTVPSLDNTFVTGYTIRFDEWTQLERYQQWYANNFGTLHPTPTVDNGLKLIAGRPVIVPLFKETSDFYRDAAIAEMPTYTYGDQDGTPQEAWVQANRVMIERALRRGAHHWSIADKAVFVAEDGMVYSVNPIFYCRAGKPDNPDELVGHVIAERFHEQVGGGPLRPGYNLEKPNRIRVTKYEKGSATTQLFRLNGNTIGAAITGVEESPITMIFTAGMGDSWYGAAQGIASRIMIAETNFDQEMYQYLNRVRYLPGSVMAGMLDRYQQTNPNALTVPLDVVRANVLEIRRPVITLEGDEQPPMESAETIDIDARQAGYLKPMYDRFFIAAGLPTSSFGIGVGAGESGYARERAQDAATARTGALRRDVSDGWPRLLRAAGMPPGEFGVGWVNAPFHNRLETQRQVLELVNAGVINAATARRMLNIVQDEEPASGNAAAPPSGTPAIAEAEAQGQGQM